MNGHGVTVGTPTSLPDASSSKPNAQTKVRDGLKPCSISPVTAWLYILPEPALELNDERVNHREAMRSDLSSQLPLPQIHVPVSHH